MPYTGLFSICQGYRRIESLALLGLGECKQLNKKIVTRPGYQRTNIYELTEYHQKLKEKIDFQSDPKAKPPFSYAALICLAMLDTQTKPVSGDPGGGKMSLTGIYEWIKENFAYYRESKRPWTRTPDRPSTA